MVVTRSALPATLVVTVDVAPEPLLLPGRGSGVSELLLAVLAIVPVAGTVKLTVLVVLAALAKDAIAGNVTIPVTGLYVPPSDTLTPVKPGMMLSAIAMLAAGLGPLLVEVII